MGKTFDFVFTSLEPLIRKSEERNWDGDDSVILVSSDEDKTGVFVAGEQAKLVASLADAIARDKRMYRIVKRALRLVDEEAREHQPAKKQKNPFIGDLIKKPLS